MKETLNGAQEKDLGAIYRCRVALKAMGAAAVPLLLDLLESDKRLLRLTGRVMLQSLTGEDFRFDRAKWEKYLGENPPK